MSYIIQTAIPNERRMYELFSNQQQKKNRVIAVEMSACFVHAKYRCE